MRDVRVREHIVPGLTVKVVRPEDEATGLTVEGVVAEVLSKEDFDPAGVVVRLATGATGRVLRVWERGAPPVAVAPRPGLPTYDEPAPRPEHKSWRLDDKAVERAMRETIGKIERSELDRMIRHHEEGIGAPLLRKHGIRSDELEKKTKDLLEGLDDEELERRLRGGGAPPPRES